MLYLQCVITSLIPSLLEASTCCPSAPGTLVSPVLHSAWNEGQPVGTRLCVPYSSPHSPETQGPHFFSPHPHSRAANQSLITLQWQLAISSQYSHLLRLPLTRHLSSACPQAVFPWSRSDPADNIYHLTDLKLKGHVIFHKKKYSEQNLINKNKCPFFAVPFDQLS